jgi:hypothetical protein
MVLAMDQGAIEGAIVDTSDGSWRNPWSDGWYTRWIREQVKERWMVQAMDQ